jgi:ATPase subunit of ABC transporter with duplicated ATPase domains
MSNLLTLDAVSASTPEGTTLFSSLSLNVASGDKVGLVGRNGSGKSTLLDIIAGERGADSGYLNATSRIGVLCQSWPEQLTVVEALGVSAIQAAINRIEQGEGADDDYAVADWTINGSANAHDVHAKLARFAFRNRDAHRVVGTLSGGELLRAGLACVLGGDVPAQLVLLDATNHLDVETIEVLEKAVASYDGALLVVSHDRSFLDTIGIERELSLGSRERA